MSPPSVGIDCCSQSGGEEYEEIVGESGMYAKDEVLSWDWQVFFVRGLVERVSEASSWVVECLTIPIHRSRRVIGHQSLSGRAPERSGIGVVELGEREICRL